MKDVPFYANTDNNMRCMLACYRSILKYFTDREYSWDELDELTGFRENKAAWTIEALVKLHKQGFEIKLIEPFDYRRYLAEGESYLPEVLTPTQAEWQLQHSNIREMKQFIPEFLEQIDYTCSMPTLADIDALLENGFLVTVVLDSRTLNDEQGYVAHMVLIYDRDGDVYMVHDPGLPPRPSRRVTRDRLWKAMGQGHAAADVTGFKIS